MSEAFSTDAKVCILYLVADFYFPSTKFAKEKLSLTTHMKEDNNLVVL